MYYSFRCTYCGRLFYAYDDSKERASRTLYYTVKQHLIDYDEDHKEYEMDDGEEIDSDQIYYEMKESNEAPVGGYEAKATGLSSGGGSGASGSAGSSFSGFVIILVLGLLIVIILGLIFFMPQFLAFLQQFIP